MNLPASYGNKQGGFTAAELLVTLFIASVFFIAGYQLYVQVTQYSKDTNQAALVSGAVYEKLREVSVDNLSNSCPHSPATQTSSKSISGYPNVPLTTVISCVDYDSITLAKVEVSGTYSDGNISRKITHVAYVD